MKTRKIFQLISTKENEMKVKQKREKLEESQQRSSCQLAEIRGKSQPSLLYTLQHNSDKKQRKRSGKISVFFLLHDYAFALLGPRIIFLIDSVNERIVLLILLYELAHPKRKQREGKMGELEKLAISITAKNLHQIDRISSVVAIRTRVLRPWNVVVPFFFCCQSTRRHFFSLWLCETEWVGDEREI